MKQPITIFIHTKRQGLMFSTDPEDWNENTPFPNPDDAEIDPDETEESDMMMEGDLIIKDGRVEIVYQESELTGMAGSTTTLGYALDTPGLITMIRDGTVSTALVFEEQKRHVCVYDTPFSSFEVSVHAIEVRNAILDEGMLDLDYLIEIRGARTEHCNLSISVRVRDEG